MAKTKRDQNSPPPVVGIGASAGGIEALRSFFDALPGDSGLAFVVIIHLAPDRDSDLPAILSRSTTMPVKQIGDHDKVKLEPNHIYVIAPDRKLEITDSSVGASRFDQPRGQRAAIDLFLRSLCEWQGDSFAILLSGAGSDGALGAKAVKENGGLVLVQAPEEAAYDSMPRSVIATGAADVILPVRELATKLIELARNQEDVNKLIQHAQNKANNDDEEEEALKKILALVKNRTGHDFSQYKRNTLLRRLARRMQLGHDPSFSAYLDRLNHSPEETRALYDDFLITVTTFFRDPDTWLTLQSQVIAPLIEQSEPDQTIRVWVPGCATGEEAYSLAILLSEEIEHRKIQREYIIFASDVDESALNQARHGLYPKAIIADVSEQRLHRYFHAEDDQYRIGRRIRDRVVFTSHSLLRDPPFLKLNLISCRNLLIYLGQELQQQLMGVFRYALRDEGYLFLGVSESVDDTLFQAVHLKHRIFKVDPTSRSSRPGLPDILPKPREPITLDYPAKRPAQQTAGDLHLKALEQCAPPSLTLDEHWNVLHLSESAARFLQQPAGPLASKITDLVRPELCEEAHSTLHYVGEKNEQRISEFVNVSLNGTQKRVAVLIQPRNTNSGDKVRYILYFVEAGEATTEEATNGDEPSVSLMRSLREKLRHAEQRIEGMRDEHHLTNEDLRAANEELQSLNEEYRSTTEELETSKEELQSINEELQSVNYELKSKLEEFSRTHNDLENLMAATDIATLFLDRTLHVNRFTPKLSEIYSVKVQDSGRPIGDFTNNLRYNELEYDAQQVINTLVPIEREVETLDGRTLIMRIRPYRTSEDRIDGVVITWIDITPIKQTEAALRLSEQKLSTELEVTQRLHRMTMAAAVATTMQGALDEVLNATIDLLGANLGIIRLLDKTTGQLPIAAQHGFTVTFLKKFALINSKDDLACGHALRHQQVIRIEDVTNEPSYEPYREAAAEAGYRAVQSSPLIDSNGEVIGLLSIHYREPHQFSDRDRQLTDILVRHATDLIISRAQQDDVKKHALALEQSEQRLRRKAEEIYEQDRNKEGFLASLGHELRNPLAGIRNTLDMIKKGGDVSIQALEIMDRQTLHMTRLIDDLLDLTRVNRGLLKLERSPVNLGERIVDAMNTLQGMLDAKSIQFKLNLPSTPISVNADSERLLQILDNLLRNAITYNIIGGRIDVTVKVKKGMAYTSVCDSGVGIKAEKVKTLFDPFQQDEISRQHGGLGLGLALVNQLLEMHEGNIHVSSDGPGTGSEFTFSLPLADSNAKLEVNQELEWPKPRRVLIVDDQKDVADSLSALLGLMGQTVTVAYNGETAMNSARKHKPAVAFLDLSMPDIRGEVLARKLREEFPSSELTLIALSGYLPKNMNKDEFVFDHCLLKPVTAKILNELLNSLDNKNSTNPA